MKTDTEWMTICVDAAQIALTSGQAPIAAILVDSDRIIGRGISGCPSAERPRSLFLDHAEILALLDAEKGELKNCNSPTLYTTLEPCVMCLGAAANLGIHRIVFAYPALPDGAKWVSDVSWTHEHDTTLVDIPTVCGPLAPVEMQELFTKFLIAFPEHRAASYVRRVISTEYRSSIASDCDPSTFDAYYEGSEWTFGNIPTDLVRRLQERLSPHSRVLELGCGDGRDAFFLGERGHSVVAIDVSAAAIRKMKARLGNVTGIAIDSFVRDITELGTLEGNFDATVGITVLDHLNEGQIERVLAPVLKLLNKGGWAAFQVHTRDDPGFLTHLDASETASWIRHYFRRGELRRRFSRHYDIDYYNEWAEPDLDHGPVHQHAFAGIIAIKK